MSKLTELEKLANRYDQPLIYSHDLKQLIKLVRLQNEALKASMNMMDEFSYRQTTQRRKGFNTLRAIEAFDKFERGE